MTVWTVFEGTPVEANLCSSVVEDQCQVKVVLPEEKVKDVRGSSSIAVHIPVYWIVSVGIDFAWYCLPCSYMESWGIGHRKVDDFVPLKMRIPVQQSMRPDILISMHTRHHKHCLPLHFIPEGLILILIVKVRASLAIAKLVVIREVRDFMDVSLWYYLFPLLQVLVVVRYAFVWSRGWEG